MLATQKGRSKPVAISSRRWLKLISPPDASAAIVLEAGKESRKGVGGQAHRVRRRIARRLGGCRAPTSCCCTSATLICWYDCRPSPTDHAAPAGYQHIAPLFPGS